MSGKEKINIDTLKQLKAGEIPAFECIYKLKSKEVYYFALGILKNTDTAEEILQETFIRLWEKRNTINPDHDISSFLFSIAHHLSIDKFRKDFRQQEKLKMIQELSESNNSTEDDIRLSDLNQALEKAIEKLPPKRKLVFTLSRMEGRDNDEISKKLNISKNTVENQIVEALKFIRKELRHFRYFFFL